MSIDTAGNYFSLFDVHNSIWSYRIFYCRSLFTSHVYFYSQIDKSKEFFNLMHSTFTLIFFFFVFANELWAHDGMAYCHTKYWSMFNRLFSSVALSNFIHFDIVFYLVALCVPYAHLCCLCFLFLNFTHSIYCVKGFIEISLFQIVNFYLIFYSLFYHRSYRFRIR